MTKVAVTETYLTDIADAIRQQTGSVDTYKPSEMASAILDIPSGGGGSSGLALNVIKEYGGNGITYTLDKTVSEIVEALNSGISPVFITTSDDGKKGYYPLKDVVLTPSSWYIQIRCTAFSGAYDVFQATGANAYPSFTQSGGGDN